jgi:hypothetical protein
MQRPGILRAQREEKLADDEFKTMKEDSAKAGLWTLIDVRR